MENNFFLRLIAALNKTKSVTRIKQDIKKLGDLFVPLIGKLQLGRTRKMINDQLKGRTYNVNLSPKINKKNVQNATNQAVNTAKKVANTNKVPLNFEVKKEQLINKLKIVAKECNKLFSNQDLTKKYNSLLNSANIAKSTADLRKVRSELSAFKTELKATGYATMSWGSKFKESIKRYANFSSGASFVYTMINQSRQASSEAKSLDDRLVDLQKVTDEIEDRDALYKYFDRAMSKAKDLNVKVDSLIYAITEFKKMGWSLDDAELGGKWSTVLSNVGDLNIDSAIGSIKTAIASFDEIGGYTDEQMNKKLEAYVDLINEMSNRYSIDAEGLAEAIRLSAGTLIQAHTTIEQAAAMFSTANRFYNDTNYLGNTAKIGSLRLRASTSTDARKELEELGEDIDDVADSASSLREKLLSLTGVDIMEADGQTFKSFYQQLLEISQVMDNLSDTSRANVLETIFGKARAAAGQALISGLQTEGVKAYETAINSAGSAMKEYTTWCESASASIQRFQNALTETYQSIVNGNTVRDVTNLGTALLNVANKFGLIQGTLRGIVAIGIGKFITTGVMAFMTATRQVEKYGVALKAVKDMPINGNLTQRYQYLKTIAVATQNLTNAQLKNVLSSKSLSQQDRVRILSLQGLSKEMVTQKLQELGLTNTTNAQTVANNAQTASVFSLKAAMIGLGRTIKTTILSNPVGVALMTISLGFSAISSAVSKHNQELEDSRQKTKEAADEASAMSDEISELANKYIKLSDAVKTDSGAKEELLSTQEELLRKLNLEGETIDTLVEKYGSLSEAIKQVSIGNLKEQQIDLIANVDATTTDLLKSADKYFGKSIVAMGKDAGKAWQVLEDSGIISSGTHTSRGGEWFLQGNNKTIEGAIQNYETLGKAVAALRDSTVFTADELADNELFQEIYKRYNNAKESVEGYSSAIDSLNKNVAHQLTISALQGKNIPKTAEEFETFKQGLIDTSIASKQFIGDEQKITSTIENYLATLPEFQEFFNNSVQEVNKIISDKSKYLDFSDLFNNDSIDSTKQKLLDLATSGELSAETITSTEDYKALLDELGISADEFVNKISEFNIQYNEDNYNSLIDLLSRVRKGEILSADEATTLIATYDSLAGELVKTGNGYSFNESAIISLTNKYAETSNLAISNEVKKTNAAIEGVKERINAYGIEMEALKTIQKIYEDTGSKIEVMNWLKDNGYSMFMASNYLDIANEYSELEKKSESLKSKMLEQIETSSVAGTSALDRITKKYKELTDVIGSNVNLILSQIKLLEAQGKEVGSAYYTELVDQSSAKIAVLTEQFNELRKEFLNTPKGTDEWLELNSAILEVQNSIIEAKTSMAEYQKTLDNMKWDRAEKIFNATSDTISSNADLLEAEINRIEANGERVGKVFYAGLIGTVEKNIAILTDRHKTLMEQLSTVEEGSDDWIELNKSIFDCQKSIIEAQKSLTEYNKTLNDIDWEKYQTIFENSTDIVSNYKDGIQTQIDIAEAQGKEVGKAYYEALISATETENDIYINRRQELLNQLGTVNEGSDEWLEIKSSIADIDQSILDCQKDIIEYQKTLKDIDFERSTEKYNAVKDVISANEDLIQAQMSQIESAGGSVGKAFYEALISNAEKSIQTETKRLSELQARLLTLDEGSEEWNSLNTEILEVQSSILGAKEKIEGFQNSINQLHWDAVDDIAEAINRISDETGNIVDLLDTDTVFDDNGLLAKDAITALAMYGEQLETAQYLINKYSKEIEYLNGEYIKGTITVEEYNSKMQELNDKQWESVDAYNAAKKAIIELRKKAIEEEIDALEELYDARKKAWEQEKDQHDWEKTVSENETNINKLKAQIAELQNDNSLAGIKKRKELEDELKKTESDWEDTLYDHVYDERQDQLDKELEDKKKALEKTLDDEEKLVADSIDLVNKNCSTVLDNLADLSKKYGIQISNSITEGFKDGENALSSYSSKFTVAHSKFTSQLEITEKKVCDVQSQADATAKSLIDMFNSTNGTLDTQLDITSGKINQAHIDADNAANAFLAMLQTQDGTLGQQIDNVRNKIEISYKTADEASLHFYQMLTAKNGTLDSQIDNTRSKIQDMYMTADTASQHIVNMFKSTNGTLGEQLSKTREAIQAIIDKANEANNALKNAGIGNGADSTPTLTPTNSGLGSTAHDNSGTTLPNAGTWKNADQDIAKDKAEAANTAKKAIDKIVQVEEKKKNQGSSKLTIGGGSKSKFTTISMGYASGTKSATKGLHPICENGVEIIEKDGCLIYPIGAFDGGEKVFSNEQTQRLWELSQNPDVMEKFRQEISNIRPYADFRFDNTAPVTKTNQNVNVQQHFDALVKVEGDMTPDVYKQLATDKRIDSLLEGKTFKYLANAYNTRGYRL